MTAITPKAGIHIHLFITLLHSREIIYFYDTPRDARDAALFGLFTSEQNGA
jgi:hypothetical protein